MNQGKNISDSTIFINNKTAHAFRQVLIKKGLLNSITETMWVRSISDEDRLLAKWRQVANTFIHKGKKVHVIMVVERFNESRVWPAITLALR